MLSNYCIFDIIDNINLGGAPLSEVVNCFQIIVSLTLLTTVTPAYTLKVRCELLSNYCIFDIIDNHLVLRLSEDRVVNCFQIIVSLTLLTTFSQLRIFLIGCELLSNYCIFDIIDNNTISSEEFKSL